MISAEARSAALLSIVEELLAAHPGRFSPLGAGLLAAAHRDLASDTRSFARSFDVAHALVIRECTLLSEEQGLLIVEDRNERSQRRFFHLSERGQDVMEGLN
ncbi:MAG: hypothetical protein AAF871_16260 [Pseudomonadota bacterium]